MGAAKAGGTAARNREEGGVRWKGATGLVGVSHHKARTTITQGQPWWKQASQNRPSKEPRRRDLPGQPPIRYCGCGGGCASSSACMAAARAAASPAHTPRAAVVSVVLACFSTPRATMHMWADWTTTSTARAPSEATTAQWWGAVCVCV